MKDEEWGNIPLPGMSDEKLLHTNWHRVAVVAGFKDDPIWRANVSNATTLQWEDPLIKEKRSRGISAAYWNNKEARHTAMKESSARPEIYAKTLANVMSRARPIVTPLGIFESLSTAARHHNIAVGTMQYRLKTKPTEYYYITQEEYKKLTGE